MNLDSPVCNQSNELSSASFCGDNEEEYLRATWQRLGVGHDGYLSLEELETVCHAIGMDKVASEVIEQLFSRLDVDGDGRISFEEFLQMFQNGGQTGANNLSLDDSLNLEIATPPRGGGLRSITGNNLNVIQLGENGFFSSLDPTETGSVTVQRIITMLEKVHVANGSNFLLDIGLSRRPLDKIRLQDLITAIEEECCPSQSTPLSSHQVSVNIMMNEVKALRTSLEAAYGERDKLRLDLNDAHQRLSLLAQELDEHTAHVESIQHHQLQELERQYKDQIRDLQEKISEERENACELTSSEVNEILSKNAILIEEENRLKNVVSSLQSDIHRLETENLEMTHQCEGSSQQIETLEKRVNHLSSLQNKVPDFDSFSPREEEYCTLLDRLQVLTNENQSLRDTNDELHATIEKMGLMNVTNRPEEVDGSLDGSCIGDYLDQPSGLGGSLKRRGSLTGSDDDMLTDDSPRGSKIRRYAEDGLDVQLQLKSFDDSLNSSNMKMNSSGPFSLDILAKSSPFKKTSSERLSFNKGKSFSFREEDLMRTPIESSHEESFSLPLFKSEKATLDESYKSCQSQKKVKFLEEHCRGLEGELTKVRVEVIKMVEDRESLLKGKQSLQEEVNKLRQVKEANTSLNWDIEQQCKTTVSKLRKMRMESAKAITPQSSIDNERSSVRRRLENIPPIPEEEEPIEGEQESANTSYDNSPTSTTSVHDSTTLKEHVDALEFEIYALVEDLRKEKEYLEKEKACVEDRCFKSEQHVEDLKSELEKSEDYWRLKLTEEQDYYDEERKLYDEKFSSLEAKIREYEEFMLTSSGTTDKNDRLTTIDESIFWEKQVTELESEISGLNKKILQLTEEKDSMEETLKQQITEIEEQAAEEASKINSQLSNTSKQLKTYQNNNIALKEELERIKKIFNKKLKENEEMCSQINQVKDFKEYPSVSMQAMINQYRTRIKLLENKSNNHQKLSHQVIDSIREQHKLDMQSLEGIIAQKDTVLASYQRQLKSQTLKSSQGDKLARDLYLENAQLMKALTVTEERQKQSEGAHRRLQLSTLGAQL